MSNAFSTMVADFLKSPKIDGLKGDSAPKTWLYSILNHKIIDHYRKKVRQPVKVENQVFSTFFDEGGLLEERTASSEMG